MNGFNKYDNADNKVWSAFTLSQFPNIQWYMDDTNSNDEFSGVDQLVTGITKGGKKETYDVELKCREFAAYNSEVIKDCYMEVKKYENMKNFNNHKKLYVAIYPYVRSGGLIYIWDLDKFTSDELNAIKTEEKMKKTTADGNSKQIMKSVFKLPTDKAIKYEFESKEFYTKNNLINK